MTNDLTEPAPSAVTTYLTVVGSATGDIGLAEQAVTFQPGDTCQTVDVPAAGGATASSTPSASFKIGVSDPNDAVLGPNDFGTVTVRASAVNPTETPLPNFGVQGTACAEYEALSHPGSLKVVGSGDVGTAVTLSGTGYRSGESVAFTDGSVALRSAIADTAGAVTLTATVPAGATATGTFSAVGVGSGFTSTGKATPKGCGGSCSGDCHEVCHSPQPKKP